MNIFTTDRKTLPCAQMLDDRRLNKMLTETCQMLSTALRHWHGDVDELWTWQLKHKWVKLAMPEEQNSGRQLIDLPAYDNHPCTRWARESEENWRWLYELWICMLYEYRWRHNKTHGTVNRQNIYHQYVPEVVGKPTSFVNCSMFKDMDDVHKAYRLTMIEKWENDYPLPTWTRQGPPVWSLTYER